MVEVKNIRNLPELLKKCYSLVHLSFQSTGSCNISSSNALNEVNVYVRKWEKGQGKQKRVWAIKMNEARELYLKTYSAVDKID